METTTKKTCKQLYEWNPAFRGMVDGWALHRWCPVEMFDLLTEEGMDDAADCAKWCYEQPERFGTTGTFRVFPFSAVSGKKHHWWVTTEPPQYQPHNRVPENNLRHMELDGAWQHATATEAILALLDAWRIA